MKNTLLKRFHLAISSHLIRARDTALAILEHHNSIELEQWKVVKERCFGHLLEGNLELIKAQSLVEDAVQDRTLLTWQPPGGESMVAFSIKKIEASSSLVGLSWSCLSFSIWSKEPSTVETVSVAMFAVSDFRVI